MRNKIKELSDIFLIRAYFDLSKGNDIACINRAYRDMNRTLMKFHPTLGEKIKDHELEKYRKPIRERWRECIIFNLKILRNNAFTSQDEFDIWHEKFCKELARYSNHELTTGQSQKWINMTIKYLVVLNDEDVIKNIKYFHIPVDAQIMKVLSEKLQILPLSTVWSKIENYTKYLDYQKKFREKFSGEIPLIKEFELFNSILEERKY